MRNYKDLLFRGVRQRLAMTGRAAGVIALVLVSVLLVSAAACTPTTAPPADNAGQSTARATATATSKTGWVAEWDKTVTAAKGEGTVLVYSIQSSSTREVLRKTFKDKYGIDLEFVTGTGTELLARVSSERTAGLYLGDVAMGGPSSSLGFKDLGALDPIENYLILPEVKDPNAWVGGSLFYFDKDRFTLGYIAMPNGTWLVNTEMLKPAEVSSYKDLLNPKWTGKMTLSDPTVSGPANALVGTGMWELMGEDYIRALAKQQPVITRDGRLLVETVARGKYPLALGPLADVRWDFKKNGAPIEQVDPVEGNITLSGSGSLVIFNKSPHPNATRVFVNWLLSKEGQVVIQKEIGGASRRVDIPKEGIDPDNVLKPGVKYIPGDTEEASRARGARQPLLREIFGIK